MAVASLRVSTEGAVHDFPASQAVVAGRDPGCDIWLSDDRVSRRHLELRPEQDHWVLTDTSTNGTWLRDQRTHQLTVRVGVEILVRVGAVDGPALRISLFPDSTDRPRDRKPMEHAPRSAHVLGRDPGCDLVIEHDDLVSREHAVVELDDGVWVRDLGSSNGTFVNGVKIDDRVRLMPGDVVGIGAQTMFWDGERLDSTTAAALPTLDARELQVTTADGKILLDKVSLVLPPGSLTAVIGPSGAGKSTLLGALTGLRPAGRGTIMWHGRDLYTEYDKLRYHIGLVPQQDIQHPQLTVRRALMYSARLRLPPDTPAAARAARVQQVLEDVALTNEADKRIVPQLSGGQRKRTSIATELITAPPLLFLDEPTSGLDPHLDVEMMTRLRALADGRRIVVVVTHNMQGLQLCDRVLLLAPGGRVAFFGPPERLLSFFRVADYPTLFSLLDDETWVEQFAESTTHERYVGDRRPALAGVADPPERPAPLAQLRTLIARQISIVAADKLLIALLVSMPILLALLARVVPGRAGLSLQATGSGGQLLGEVEQRLTVLVLGAALMGAALGVRELVKERPIFAREYAVGLSPAAYLASKALVLGTLAALQAVVFTVLALAGLPGPDGHGVLGMGVLEVAVAVAGVAVAVVVAGLAVSAMVSSSEQSMPALVGLVMVQLVLSGALIPLSGRVGLAQLSWLAPARFGYAATASSVGLGDRPLPPGQESDPLFASSPAQWLTDMAAVGLLAGLFAAIAYWALTRSAARRGVG